MDWRAMTMKQYLLISLAVIAISGLVLHLMGQAPICDCGYVKFWHGEIHSQENSKHLTDWYTFSHVIHGFGFYFLLWLIFRKRLLLGLLLVMAVAMEAAWEIFENTDMIINRYRSATVSLEYYGDTIINSLADQLAMVLGFFLAWRLPVKVIILLVLAMELFIGYSIRDNLTLNIIMLIHPLDFIREWQGG